MRPTVVIIGRPNVGKSTLFNRLAGRRLALVDDQPGVTRDWREAEAVIEGRDVRILDTAGLEDADADSIEGRMRRQTEQALARADVAVLLIDARAGLMPLDEHFAEWLRRQGIATILAANKCEGRAAEAGLLEAFKLGLGEPLAISAEHGQGIGDLHEAIAAALPPPIEQVVEHAAAADEDNDEGEAEDDYEPTLQLAILGRPNAGKSTLVNRLLGEERMLTGPEPGLTRDAVASIWSWQGREVRLYDTAGLRRQARVTGRVERMAAGDAKRAMAYAQVVVLLIDATQPLEKQDLTIARQTIEEGRAIVIAANKWDLVKDQRATMQVIRDRLQTSLTQVRGVPIVTLSALTGKGVNRLMPKVFEIYDKWQRRVPTGQLNRWLEELTARHPPPLGKAGRRIRLRYATQAKARPPTFVFFTNLPDDLPDAYLRYLQNGLRDAFGLDGVPLRLQTRKPKNPYAND